MPTWVRLSPAFWASSTTTSSLATAIFTSTDARAARLLPVNFRSKQDPISAHQCLAFAHNHTSLGKFFLNRVVLLNYIALCYHSPNIAQLDNIRRTSSLAKLLCTTSDRKYPVQQFAFFPVSKGNPRFACSQFPEINYNLWRSS